MDKGKNIQAIIILILVILLIGVLVGFIWYNTEMINNMGKNNENQIKLEQVLKNKDKEIENLSSQLKEKEQEILKLNEITQKNKEEEKSQLKEKEEKIKALEKSIKEQEEKITTLTKEISSIKNGIKKRVTLKSDDWRRASGQALLGSFRFDSLDNVEKIGISFTNGYQKINAVDINNNNSEIYLSLNRTQQTGTATVIIENLSGGIHVNLEIYYKDGRTETITTLLAMG